MATAVIMLFESGSLSPAHRHRRQLKESEPQRVIETNSPFRNIPANNTKAIREYVQTSTAASWTVRNNRVPSEVYPYTAIPITSTPAPRRNPSTPVPTSAPWSVQNERMPSEPYSYPSIYGTSTSQRNLPMPIPTASRTLPGQYRMTERPREQTTQPSNNRQNHPVPNQEGAERNVHLQYLYNKVSEDQKRQFRVLWIYHSDCVTYNRRGASPKYAKAANGTTISFTGRVSTEETLESDESLRLSLLVANDEHCPEEVLLGMDTLRINAAVLDMGQNKLLLNGVDTPLINSLETISQAPILLKNDMILQPHTDNIGAGHCEHVDLVEGVLCRTVNPSNIPLRLMKSTHDPRIPDF
uniref:Reverse transcriptase n=1 Tax=Panagrellus redivivus TaxID=6233 RepID=A0A7E4V1P3_PANRE